MTTKRYFKKRTLLKKHKKVNLTKKHNKSRLTKTIINKLVGGAGYNDDEIIKFNKNVLPNLKTLDDCDIAIKKISDTQQRLDGEMESYKAYGKLNTYSEKRISTVLPNLTAKQDENIKLVRKKRIELAQTQGESMNDKLVIDLILFLPSTELKGYKKILLDLQETIKKSIDDKLINLANAYIELVEAYINFKSKKSKRNNLSSAVEVATTKVNKEIETLKGNTEPIQISHMWFKKWPDHGVPEKMDDFQAFISRVFDDMNIHGGNTVIHCSAGVGRTGVVYVVLKLLSEGNEFDSIKVEAVQVLLKKRIDDIINEERKNRNQHFVQTDIQYNFIYKYFTGGDMLNYDTEFNKLSKTGCKPEDVPKISIMGNRNRYSDIIPCESKRVMLKDVLKGDNTYINASNMTPLTVNGREIKIIAAQCPKDDATIKDFYQMVKDTDNNIKRIIMVTGLSEKGAKKCEDYFGSGLNNFQPIPNSDNMVVSSKVEHKDIYETRILTNQQPSASQHIPSNSRQKYNTTPPVPSRNSKSAKLIANATQTHNPSAEQAYASAAPTGRKPIPRPRPNVPESQRIQFKIDTINKEIEELEQLKLLRVPDYKGRVDISITMKILDLKKERETFIKQLEELKKNTNPFL